MSSTPHKLNVTFWDMPEEKVTHGYHETDPKTFRYRMSTFFKPKPIRIGLFTSISFLVWWMGIPTLALAILPYLAVASAFFWHAILTRGTISLEIQHLIFCTGILGEVIGHKVSEIISHSLSEVIGHSVSEAIGTQNLIHLCILGLAAILLGRRDCSLLLLLHASCRGLVLVCVPGWVPAKAGICYATVLAGTVLAKFVEAFLVARILPDVRLSTPRRRRSSNHAIFNVYKMRRTSLPALGGSLKASNHGLQGSASTVDVALLAEAHGLVTDMLADPHLPPHVMGGLRALASLLSPASPHPPSRTHRPTGGASVALADFNSDEEIPYTGEKPSALTKRLRRNLPPSILRRMSTSTWTTTTSATGLPTLEPEPSRKRSTSFRHPTDAPSSQNTSPRGGSPGCALSPSRSPHQLVPGCKGGRSYSTTSIPCRRNSRGEGGRKTGSCSLHPLTSAEIEAFHEQHTEDDLQLFHRRMLAAASRDAEETTEEDDEEEGARPLPPLPCIRRPPGGLVSSDYESSNESPVSSENNEPLEQHSRCTMCGARTKGGEGTMTTKREEVVMTTTRDDDQDNALGLLVNGHRFDLEALDADPLLNRINEWDYPIFDLKEQSKDLILSQMCYKVFQEVGLFEAFKIPVQEFLNYFHAVESGYREKPYHNRMHAADVLQGVYYLTSQPIPGFTQIPSTATDSPLHKTASGEGSHQRTSSFAADASYGVLGANYPALELMALYAAAATHDYDHPGRTNAFLVATHAPQAILYNDRSVLENHHAAAAWNLFLSRPEFNFLCHLDTAEFKRFRFLVIECILATDLKRHFEIVAEFNAKTNEEECPGVDWMSEADRLLAMNMCIKLADINGPCKRHDIHVQWTHRIAEEFYEQGDEEADLGLQVSPYMDRNNPQLAKLQESFISHLVAPLCNAYGEGGLLPGTWEEDEGSSSASSSSADNDSSDETETLVPKCSEEGTSTGDSVLTVASEGDDGKEAGGGSKSKEERSESRRKVRCLQTIHLRENYDYWVEVHKRELADEEEEEEEKRRKKKEEEEEMETIEEEGQRLTPPAKQEHGDC